MSTPQLTVIVPASEVDEVQREFATLQVSAERTGDEGFDGTQAVSLLVPLLSATIPALVSVYKARVAADKHITYISDSFEVKGVSNETLSKLVELHARRDARERSDD